MSGTLCFIDLYILWLLSQWTDGQKTLRMLDVVEHAFNPSIWTTRGLKIVLHPWLQSKSEFSLSYMRPYLKKSKPKARLLLVDTSNPSTEEAEAARLL